MHVCVGMLPRFYQTKKLSLISIFLKISNSLNFQLKKGTICIGPHVRGLTDTIRGLGSLASPRTFGHGGVGSSYCWADPDSGVSFAYLTNGRVPDPWHSARLDLISNAVHMAID